MARLNIKKVPDGLYKTLQARARRQHRSLAEEPRRRTVLELRGLGKEALARPEAIGHVERDRRSWD